MLILDKIRQIKDKKIAVELAKWCAKEAAADADAARVAGDAAWDARAASRAAAWAARAASRAECAAESAKCAARAAKWARAAKSAAESAEWAAFCNKVASKLKELTEENFYYRMLAGSRDIFEQLDDQIKIGCISKPKQWWVENYEFAGRENCYTKDQIKEYGSYIKGEKL